MVMGKTAQNKSNKRRDVSNFIMMCLIIVLVNFVLSFYFARFDLTSEKRYTLAESTKKLLKNLDDIVFLKVYLHGDLNADFTRLHDETKEMLDEFRAYSNNNVEYEFINPNENPNKEEVMNLQKQLNEKGIVPEQVIERRKQKTSGSIIWPGAIATHKGRETVWQIYSRQIGYPTEMSVNNSVEDLEYGLSNTIRKLQTIKKPEVCFVEGHGELDTLAQFDFMNSLSEYYNISRVFINEQFNALKGVDAIVISQPDSSFAERDKFIIDQFIMNGGKVLWMLDPVYINRDTFRLKGMTLGLSNDFNLGDMLFRYGVRLNPVLVQDMQCSRIPINLGFRKGQENFQLFRWVYNPIIIPDGNHPTVKNLDPIKLDFASTIDTISAAGIKKTVLLKTSRYTKTQPSPSRIALAMATFPLKESQFMNPYQNVACLLEGEFDSNYKNRARMTDSAAQVLKVKEHGVKTKMIVIADGDIVRNDIAQGQIQPLGYDRYEKTMFANKTFLLNCMNYMLDDEGLLQLRAREVKLRLLDPKKVAKNESKWQLINIILPLGILIAFGLIQFYFRKKRYSG
jgi:ABC-2 type transport system permease protein